MELKKNPKYDLDKKQGIFRNLGLTITLLAVIVVFEMPPRGEEEIIDLGETNQEVVEVIDIPVTKQPPPPPPQLVKALEIVEVPDEVEIEEEIEVELDVEVTEVTTVEEVVFNPTDDMEEEVAEEVFLVVEDEPQFPGGIQAFYAFISEQIRYPSAARKAQVQGRVYVQFVIEKDGSLTDMHVLKGIGAGCDEEAIRVLQLVPKFIPGKQRGVPVRVRKVFPIYFKLAEI